MKPILYCLGLIGAALVACGSDRSDPQQSDDELRRANKCGGFAGITCAAGYECVDDPTDTCDPANGGRDCIGNCKKKTVSTGTDAGGADSGTSTSDAGSTAHDSGVTPSNTCGGFAGIPCPSGQMCVDDPNDTCDPDHGGADCGGICVAEQSHACGGFAGIPCPSGQICADDPNDTCDPNNGGADCGGICVPR
jgi:hypothetical protein